MNILSAYKKSGSVIINSKETGKCIRYKKGPLYRGSTVCNLVPGVLSGPQVEDNLVTRFTLYVGIKAGATRNLCNIRSFLFLVSSEKAATVKPRTHGHFLWPPSESLLTGFDCYWCPIQTPFRSLPVKPRFTDTRTVTFYGHHQSKY